MSSIITIKNDWYNDLLGELENNYVSGHNSFSQKLNLSNENKCAIRFITIDKTLLIFLTIETNNITDINNELLTNDHILKLKEFFKTDFHILVFDNKSNFKMAKYNHWNFINCTSEHLQSYVGYKDTRLVENTGTYKAINKSLNDGFQIWTRTYLTKNCVVNDIDALVLDGSGGVMFELKRVKSSLHEWMPYLNDYYNYKAFIEISKKFNLDTRIIAYNLDLNKEVACHFLVGLNEDRSLIRGTYMRLDPTYTIGKTLGLEYKSTNKTY